MRVSATTLKAIAAVEAETGGIFHNYKDGVVAVKTSQKIETANSGIVKSSNPHNGGFVTKVKIGR